MRRSFRYYFEDFGAKLNYACLHPVTFINQSVLNASVIVSLALLRVPSNQVRLSKAFYESYELRGLGFMRPGILNQPSCFSPEVRLDS